MSNESMLICTSVHSDEVPVTNSTQSNCTVCDDPVWVAPTSAQLMIDGAKPICYGCAQSKMESQDEFGVDPPTQEQIDEIKKSIPKNQWRGLDEFIKGIPDMKKGDFIKWLKANKKT